jgi:hydroxyacylglutathione hydrolase
MGRLRELEPGVLIATADFGTSTTTVLTGQRGECVLVDPGISVEDLTALAADLNDAGLRPVAGFSTHPHWDHLLWSRELGGVPRYGAPAAVALLADERQGMEDMLQLLVPGHDLTQVGRLTPLPGDRLPWDGPDTVLTVHDAHAPGHAAVFLPESGVLLVGDMLSDIEIPILDTVADEPLRDYQAGLDALAAIAGVRWVVPGHGQPGDAAEFRRRADADQRYLDRLAAGEPFDDPRCTADWMRKLHDEQLRVVAGRPG